MSGEATARRTTLGLLFYWGPFFVWFGGILYFSGDAASAGRTGSILEPIIRWFWPDASAGAVYGIHVLIRKLAHIAEYAVLALLLYRAWRSGRPAAWNPGWAAAVFGLSVLCASVDELRQSFASSRSGTISDVVIDALGAAAAMAVLAWWRTRAARASKAG